EPLARGDRRASDHPRAARVGVGDAGVVAVEPVVQAPLEGLKRGGVPPVAREQREQVGALAPVGVGRRAGGHEGEAVRHSHGPPGRGGGGPPAGRAPGPAGGWGVLAPGPRPVNGGAPPRARAWPILRARARRPMSTPVSSYRLRQPSLATLTEGALDGAFVRA